MYIYSAETSASIDKSVHLEMGIPAPGTYVCSHACVTLQLGLPEQAMGWLPLRLERTCSQLVCKIGYSR